MNEKKIRTAMANNLKDARKAKGFTQSEVAEKTGMNVSHYAKIERGEIMPTVLTLHKITEAIDVKSSKILPF